jgi:hypothetical protein
VRMSGLCKVEMSAFLGAGGPDGRGADRVEQIAPSPQTGLTPHPPSSNKWKLTLGPSERQLWPATTPKQRTCYVEAKTSSEDRNRGGGKVKCFPLALLDAKVIRNS